MTQKRSDQTKNTDRSVGEQGSWFDRKGAAVGSIGDGVGLAGSSSKREMMPLRFDNSPAVSGANLQRPGPFSRQQTKRARQEKPVSQQVPDEVRLTKDAQPDQRPAHKSDQGAAHKIVVDSVQDPRPQAQETRPSQVVAGQDAKSSTVLTAQASGKPILQLVDFEPNNRSWRRAQKEPVAPRVHPNPTPVRAEAENKKRKGKKKSSRKSLGFKIASVGTSTDSSIVGTFNGGQGREPGLEAFKQRQEDRETRDERVISSHAQSQPSLSWPLARLLCVGLLLAGGLFYLSSMGAKTQAERQALARTQQVKGVEAMLLTLSYDPGLIDGLIDSDLVNAVREFQETTMPEVNGQIDDALEQELSSITAALQF